MLSEFTFVFRWWHGEPWSCNPLLESRRFPIHNLLILTKRVVTFSDATPSMFCLHPNWSAYSSHASHVGIRFLICVIGICLEVWCDRNLIILQQFRSSNWIGRDIIVFHVEKCWLNYKVYCIYWFLKHFPFEKRGLLSKKDGQNWS